MTANIHYSGPARMTSWRRLAMGAWGPPRDPTIYGFMDIDAAPMQARIEQLRAAGSRVTITHLVARAIAVTLARHPDANVMPRFGRVWQRETVDVFMQVAIPGEDGRMGSADLSGLCVREADAMSVTEMSEQVNERVQRIKGGDDPEMKATKRRMGRTPGLLMRGLMRVVEFLQYGLNLDLSAIGIPRDPFGSVLVSNMGTLGVENAFAPLFPVGGPPIVLLVGAVRPMAVVDEQGAVVARPMLRIGGTFDHRVLDGYQTAVIAREMRSLLEDEVDTL